MGSVWKRLQRVNKRAAKFQFTASYHELHLETTAKWRPSNLSVVWTRRSRRVASAPLPWEPDMMNPLAGCIAWSVPDNHSISVTLFKDPRTHELEDKDWTFVLEDITPLGKKRILANSSINMKKYASIESTQQSFTLTFKPISRKITSASLELTLSCVFLREGKATDEDMQSVVSLMSVNNNCDVAPLDDLEDIPDLESTDDISDHLYDFTHQLEELTTSLNYCMDFPTPLSVPSLSEDPTPLAEINNVNFENNSDKPHIQDDESLKTPNAINSILNNISQKLSSTNSTTDNIETADANVIQKQKQELKSQDDLPSLIETTPFVTSTPITKIDDKSTKTEHNAKKCLSFLPEAEVTLKNTSSLEINQNVESVLKSKTEIKNNEHLNQITHTSKKPNSQIKVDTPIKELTNQTIEINSSQTLNAKSDIKRADLPPLNLRKNYDFSYNQNLPINPASNNKPMDKVVLKENTPGQDLLEWCKEVTKDYPNVKVTNLTTSWRNGMAFCAIINHFEPNLIDMTKLSAHDVVGNCRNAFDAAETLGIPRVIEPRDMSLLAVPDKLAVMTYLHQLRAHFTGKQLQIEQIGPTSDESSYIIGNYKSDNVSQNLFNLNNLNDHLKNQSLLNDDLTENFKQQLSPTSKKEAKNKIFTSSKHILGKVLSPSKEKYFVNGSHHTNLSPDEEVEKYYSISSENGLVSTTQQPLSPIDSNTANRILSRHKEMSEKAKMMMEKLKISANNEKKENDELRQQRLREQARRLILETRTKSPNDSPSTPTKSKRIHFTPERTISPIPNGSDEIVVKFNIDNTDQFMGENFSNKVPTTPKKKITPPRDIDIKGTTLIPSPKLSEQYKGSSHLQTFNAVMERISPKTEKKGDKVSYIESELEALEREQEAVDRKASNLEKKLRAVMGGNPKSEETEEQLLSQWFTLVNKKNALLRRQMQLNILEQESDLELKYTMLNQELRAAQSVEDWRKTEAQREKERLLLEELVSIVDKRDQLVQHLHSQEIAIEDDHEIARELEQVDISGNKEKCVIQ